MPQRLEKADRGQAFLFLYPDERQPDEPAPAQSVPGVITAPPPATGQRQIYKAVVARVPRHTYEEVNEKVSRSLDRVLGLKRAKVSRYCAHTGFREPFRLLTIIFRASGEGIILPTREGGREEGRKERREGQCQDAASYLLRVR